jgi:uncharacterized protein (TIGR03435 family)
MARGLTRRAIALVVFVAAASAQTFEVASVKPHPAGVLPVSGIPPRAGGSRMEFHASLRGLLAVAYHTSADVVSGGPGWVVGDLWDVSAKAAKQSSADDLRIMMQNLLAERFKLKIQRSSKMFDAYAVTIGAAAFKGTAHSGGGEPKLDFGYDTKVSQGLITVTSCTIDEFLDRSWIFFSVPLRTVNHTGLTGYYDFKVHYVRQGGNIPGPTLEEGLQKELGLKLERTKAPVVVISIERAEKPTAN